MGLMIRDMKMPEDCDRCPLYVYRNDAEDICSITKEGLFHVKPGERHDRCPLGEINSDKICRTADTAAEQVEKMDRFYRDIVYHLMKVWGSGDPGDIEKYLQDCSNATRKIKKVMQTDESSLDYGVGKLSGMLETFIRIYQNEHEIAVIDEVVSRNYAIDKRILSILSDETSGDWVSSSKILSGLKLLRHTGINRERYTRINESTLLNTIKPLINAGAVEFFQEQDFPDFYSFRLTPAGKRYMEKDN